MSIGVEHDADDPELTSGGTFVPGIRIFGPAYWVVVAGYGSGVYD